MSGPGTAAVLMYHRVAEEAVDPWELAVAPRRFAAQLDVLQQHYDVVALGDIVDTAASDRPRPAVALTFDDGYADVLAEAAPALARRRMPATVFVVSGKTADGGAFWWDELERLLLHAGELPGRLEMRMAGTLVFWNLGDSASGDAARLHSPGWMPWQTPDPTPRHAAFLGLWEMLQRLSPAQLEHAMEQLREWGGPAARRRMTAAPRTLSADGVAALARAPGIEVGSHTRTHTALSALSVSAQRDEILRCRDELAKICGCPIRSFSYPYGRRRDFTADSIALAREAGFACACAGFPGPVSSAVDRFQIPRLHIGNWDSEPFARRLASAFGSTRR